MDTMKDTKMQPATDAVINELRMLAEDLYVNRYNRYSSAMSQAADELEQLRAKVERMEKVIDALGSGLNAVAKERDALRAKVAAMEKQEPECEVVGQVHNVLYEVRTLKYDLPAGTKLYALPGAQPQLNEIKIALQRALELGRREAWTGVRKHRSWEDQREEQQCWNKVWSLLGAPGEEK